MSGFTAGSMAGAGERRRTVLFGEGGGMQANTGEEPERLKESQMESEVRASKPLIGMGFAVTITKPVVSPT